MPIKFSCPFCGQHLEADEGASGQSCECPSCNKSFVIGTSASVAAPSLIPPPMPMRASDAGSVLGSSSCKNHPGVPAAARCAGCQEAFCANCLVDLGGRQYCGACKVLAVKNTPIMEEACIPCKEAGEALTLAIVGIFCFGIILAPLALVKASKARKMIEKNPRLLGSGKVTAAQIIAAIVLVLSVLGIVAKVSHPSRF